MTHARLLVQGCDGLCARRFPTACVHGLVGHRAVHGAERVLDELAAVVDLGDDAVGLVLCGQVHRSARPAVGAVLAARVFEHVTPTVETDAAHDDARLVAGLARAHGRVNRDDNAPQLGRGGDSRCVDSLPRPERARGVCEHLAVELLSPEAGAAVAPLEVSDDTRREVGAVVERAAASDDGAGRGEQRANDRRWTRCGGHHDLRGGAEAKAEDHLIPCVGALPRCELVGPRVMMLRAAKLIGHVGAVGCRHRAIRPRQPAARRLPRRALARGVHREDAALALDQHVTHVGGGAGDKSDATARVTKRTVTHPFGPGAGLAPAAARENEPPLPRARGRELIGARPHGPAVEESSALSRRQARQDLRPSGRRGERGGERGRHRRRHRGQSSQRRASPRASRVPWWR